MRIFPTLTHRESRLFFCALVATALFILFFIAHNGVYLPPQGLNSDGYWPLAERLSAHHDFFRTEPPFFPEVTHLPGYPFFLALFGVPFGSVVPALLIQALLMGLSAVFLYRLTEGVFSEKVRFFSALLFSVEPFTAFTAAAPLSEALCLFFLLSALYMCRKAWDSGILWQWAVAGLLFGGGIMVRPILMYAIPIVAVFAAIILFRRSPRECIRGVSLLLVGAFLLPGLWMIRNHAHFDLWILSNKGPFTLYTYDATELVVQRDGVSTYEANQRLFAQAKEQFPELTSMEDLRHPRYAAYLTGASATLIKANLPLYLKIHATSLGTFFFSDGYRLLLVESGLSTKPLPNITRALLQGDLSGVIDGLMGAPLSFVLLVLGATFWFGIFILALFSSIIALWKRDDKKKVFVILLFVAFIAYFAMLTGPVAQARYRIMITPFLFPLALYGASLLRGMYASRVSARTS